MKINQWTSREEVQQPAKFRNMITDRIFGDTSSVGSTCIETQIIETNNWSQDPTRMC